MYELYDNWASYGLGCRGNRRVGQTVGVAPTHEKIVVVHHCDNCGEYMELTSDQRWRQRKDPNSKFYCDHECHMEAREQNKREVKGPWSWLKCTKVLDCLPTQEPPEIWVGY